MEWINFEDEYPENGKVVLCCDNIDKVITLGYYNDETEEMMYMNMFEMPSDSCATHWMNLPSFPEEVI